MSLTTLIAGAGCVIVVLAVCGAAYSSLAAWMLWRFLRRPATPTHSQPSVSVLKPLRGAEPELYANLASFCAQSYGGPVQLILGAQDRTDLALAIAERLQKEHPGRDIVVVNDPTVHGANRKIGNLINMAVHASGEVVVISDSDVGMPAYGLDRIVGALHGPNVGLVYCLYRGRPTTTIWSKLAAMDINTRFAPSVVVGEALGAGPCLGPTMALRADLLGSIGGFERLASVLADDFELGEAVRAAGYRVACPPMLIDHTFPERSAGEMLAHELRWARTVRLVQPAGYLGSVIVYVTPLALIGAALTGFAGWSIGALIVLALFRQLQAYVVSRLMGSRLGLLWLLPIRDLLSFAVFLAGIFGDRVEWRGNRLLVRRDGVIAAT